MLKLSVSSVISASSERGAARLLAEFYYLIFRELCCAPADISFLPEGTSNYPALIILEKT